MELDESSRPITTFITHQGLYRYKRLLFGVNSAPEIFQRRLEEVLAPFPSAFNYLDDVIIYGMNEQEFEATVAAVKKTFEDQNILLNEDKCIWKTKQMKFLGHILSTEGIEIDPEKVRVILQCRPPTTREETRSFLGLVSYVGKFIPDLATNTEPLWRLTGSNVKFVWGEVEDKAFKYLKKPVWETFQDFLTST